MTLDITKLPKTPDEAVATGKRYYFTGRPCKRGHIAERYVGNQMCMACKRMTYATGPSRAWNVVQPPSGIPFPADTPQTALTPQLISAVWGDLIKLSYGVICKRLNEQGIYLPAQLRPQLVGAPESYEQLIAKGITEYQMANNGWIVDRPINKDRCPRFKDVGYLFAIASGHAIHEDFVRNGWLAVS